MYSADHRLEDDLNVVHRVGQSAERRQQGDKPKQPPAKERQQGRDTPAPSLPQPGTMRSGTAHPKPHLNKISIGCYTGKLMDFMLSEKILPKTKGPVACPMMLVEPGSGEVAELVHHRVAKLSSKFQDRCLDGGVEKESQECVGITIGVHGENGSKVGARLKKLCPVGDSICSGISKARTLASSKVEERSRGVARAARNSAKAAGVPRPVAAEPASAIPATQHSSLHS